MTLSQYYQANDANKSNIFAPAEIGELRESIKTFLNGFSEAFKKDIEHEEVDTQFYNLKKAYFSNAYLIENKTSLLGFADYLKDFSGFNDNIIREGLFNLTGFSFIVLKFGHPFEESRHRLIELCNDYTLAVYAPHYDEVATYVLSNFDMYKNKKAYLETILAELEDLKQRCKKNKVSFEVYSSPCILYKIIKRKLSAFKTF